MHRESTELAVPNEIPAGARPLGIKVRPVLRLALGHKDPDRGHPIKTEYFQPRSESQAAIDRFASKYGDKPKTVRILLPADLNDALDIRYVAFKGAPGAESGGNLVAIGQTNYALRDYMGGPDTITVWNQDGTVSELDIEGPDDEQLGDIQLGLRTRLRFGIPDVLGFGSFAEVQTGGKESTDSLWLKTRELYAIFGSRVTVAVEPLLVLRASTMRAPKFEGRGKDAKQVGWQKAGLWVVDLVVPESIEEMLTRLRDRQQVLAPNGPMAAIYGAGAPPALGPGRPAAAVSRPQGSLSQAGGPEPQLEPAGAPPDEPPLEVERDRRRGQRDGRRARRVGEGENAGRDPGAAERRPVVRVGCAAPGPVPRRVPRPARLVRAGTGAERAHGGRLMPRGVPGSKGPHGTVNRYTSHGCRCRLCKDAIRDYEREKFGHRPREVVDAERAAQHGTESKYRAGCRCESCRRAATQARRERRRANREAANAYDREYRRRRQAVAA
jgi:hypothetical protein